MKWRSEFGSEKRRDEVQNNNKTKSRRAKEINKAVYTTASVA